MIAENAKNNASFIAISRMHDDEKFTNIFLNYITTEKIMLKTESFLSISRKDEVLNDSLVSHLKFLFLCT